MALSFIILTLLVMYHYYVQNVIIPEDSLRVKYKMEKLIAELEEKKLKMPAANYVQIKRVLYKGLLLINEEDLAYIADMVLKAMLHLEQIPEDGKSGINLLPDPYSKKIHEKYLEIVKDGVKVSLSGWFLYLIILRIVIYLPVKLLSFFKIFKIWLISIRRWFNDIMSAAVNNASIG